MQDYLMPQENLCPVEYFAARGNVEKMAEAEQLKDITFYNSGPGSLYYLHYKWLINKNK